eukprot:gene13070-14415_t
MGSGGRQFPPPKKQQKALNSQSSSKESWSHEFCALANTNESRAPSQQHLNLLHQAGLGKKRLSFPKNGTHDEVLRVFETGFPKQCSQKRAIDLFKAKKGGKQSNLIAIHMSSTCYTMECIGNNVAAFTIVYIRPVQSNMSLAKVVPEVDSSIHTESTNEDRALSDEDEYMGHSAFSSIPGSSGTTQGTWRLQLEMLFPDVKADSIDAAIQKMDTLEEAANCITDNSQNGSTKEAANR